MGVKVLFAGNERAVGEYGREPERFLTNVIGALQALPMDVFVGLKFARVGPMQIS